MATVHIYSAVSTLPMFWHYNLATMKAEPLRIIRSSTTASIHNASSSEEKKDIKILSSKEEWWAEA